MPVVGSGAGVRIADLYAALGITADRKSFDKARADINKFSKDVAKQLERGARKENFLGKMSGLGSRLKNGAGGLAAGLGTRALRGAKSQISGLASVLGLGVTGGLAAGFGFAFKNALDFEKSLTDIDIASKGAMGKLDDVRQQMLATSKSTGVAKEDLLSAASSFVALTGDGKAASQMLELFGQVNKATGASMEDISASAAAMSQNLGISTKDMEKGFSIMIAGGKAGAIEMKDMAGLLAGLSAQSKSFAGGTGLGGTASISAALQIARQDFGSASEASTGLESLMGAIVNNAKKLEKAGIKVFNKDAKTGVKTLRGFDEIVNAIGESKLAKDPTLLFDALGRKEAIRAFGALTKTKGAWDALAKSTLKADDVAKDYARRQQSTAEKVSRAWNDLKVKVAEAFTPERIAAFAGLLEKIVGWAAGLVDSLEWIIDKFDPMDSQQGRKRREEEGRKFNEDRAAIAARAERHRKENEQFAKMPQWFQDQFGGALARKQGNEVMFGALPNASVADQLPTTMSFGDFTVNIQANQVDEELLKHTIKGQMERRLREAAEATEPGLEE